MGIDQGIEAILERVEQRLQRIEEMLQLEEAPKEVMSVAEAAEYTGYSKNYLYRLTSDHQIPHYKRGGKLVFNRAELDKWLLHDRVRTDEEVKAEADNYCALHN